jgi:ABC-type branched-subunit amino acid transport system ATPase component
VEPGLQVHLLAFLAGLEDANERAEQVLEMIKLDKRRDVLAMNLTYAEQRALEIGITIAGGADVILLDEPTAGMSKSETERFVELIREVTEGKTLLTVEHDMGVVFGLADKIAVLVYGEVIAFDTPERCAPTPRCRRPTWARCRGRCRPGGRTLSMLKSSNLHAFYGKSHVLHGVDFDVEPARSSRCWAQRLGPLDHRQGHHGPGGVARARAMEGPGDPGQKAYEIAHLGIGYVPESRDIFPN